MPSVRLFIVPCPSARPKAPSTRSATREEVSTLPAATAAPGARVEQRALGRAHLDRPVGAGGRRDVGVGQHAHGEQAGRARDGERAVEVAVVLGRAAGEVEHQPLAVDGRAQAQHEVALAAPRARPRRARSPSGSAARHARVRRSA